MAAADCGGNRAPTEAVSVSTHALAPGGAFSSANLALQVSKNSCANNVAQDYFQVTNMGSAAVSLSDVTIKYWINDTSGPVVVPHVWYGGCVTSAKGTCVHTVSNVTATPVAFPACGPDATHQANWEITVSTTDPAALSPGFTWSGVQTAVNLANYANFSPGSGTWYSGCGTGQPFAADAHFAVYVKGNLVFSNGGIAAPSCRAPHGTQPISTYTLPPASPVVGALAPTTKLSLAVGLPLRQFADLQSRVDAASDPASPTFRKWLTDADLATYYPLAADYAKLVAWATASGFTVTTHANNMTVDLLGTASQVEQALFVNLITARRPDGSVFYAPDRIPTINLDVPVLGISGLDNYVLPKPVASGGTAPVGGGFQSNDFRGAYLGAGTSCSTLTGKGQTIGIFTWGVGINIEDIHQYEANLGLVDVPEVQVQVGGPAGTQPLLADGEGLGLEAALDVEMAIAMAPKAQVVVFEGTDPDQILQKIAENTDLKQISSSWNIFLSANAPQLYTVIVSKGVSFFQASGDGGSYALATIPKTATTPACGPVPSLFSNTMPYITMVGGTELNTMATVWKSETAATISGGGIISALPIPPYQVGATTTNPEFSTTFRNAPDVAMPADRAYYVATSCGGAIAGNIGDKIPLALCNLPNSTQCDPAPDGVNGIIKACNPADLKKGSAALAGVIGGTSVASPLWAGLTALINEQKQTGSVGFLNPAIYAIGKDNNRYAASFHDIGSDVIVGSTVSCDGLVYNARSGYDLVTGWGSPQCGLVGQLVGTPNQPPPPPPPSFEIRATATQLAGSPVTMCGSGTGFTPGGSALMVLTDIPGFEGLSFTRQSFALADANGTLDFGIDANSLPGQVSCSPAQLAQNVTVTVTDFNTGVLIGQGGFPARFFCFGQTGATDFNGGCP